MASIKLVNFIKYNKCLYIIYNATGTFLVKVLKIFLCPNDKLILFTSFSGRRYDDSPRAVYEKMIADPRFDSYDFVWAFRQPKEFILPKGRKVKIDTFEYYKIALQARVWMTNVGITRGLNFDGIQTFYINSWHGSAIKYIGSDIHGQDTFKVKKSKHSLEDIYLAQGEFDIDTFSRAFLLPKSKVVLTGLPRNDELVTGNTVANAIKIREKLHIPQGKKVILYAPTYREYEKDKGNNCIMKPPFDMDKWKNQLGSEYILLIRAHQEVVNVLGINEDNFVKNVSNYPILNELMLITDMLISDYSSIMFDFSILGKPIFCYTYDYDRYEKERGMYFDIRKELPSESDEDSLIKLIKEGDYSELSEKTVRFREKYVTEYGSASQKAVDIIYDAIN